MEQNGCKTCDKLTMNGVMLSMVEIGGFTQGTTGPLDTSAVGQELQMFAFLLRRTSCELQRTIQGSLTLALGD